MFLLAVKTIWAVPAHLLSNLFPLTTLWFLRPLIFFWPFSHSRLFLMCTGLCPSAMKSCTNTAEGTAQEQGRSLFGWLCCQGKCQRKHGFHSWHWNGGYGKVRNNLIFAFKKCCFFLSHLLRVLWGVFIHKMEWLWRGDTSWYNLLKVQALVIKLTF